MLDAIPVLQDLSNRYEPNLALVLDPPPGEYEPSSKPETVAFVGGEFILPRFLSSYLPTVGPCLSHTSRSYCLRLSGATQPDILMPELLPEQLPGTLQAEREAPLLASLTVPNESRLQTQTVLAVCASEDSDVLPWPDILLQTDRLYVLLSGVRMLAMEERKLIAHHLHDQDFTYLLLDMEQLPDGDAREVESALHAIDPGHQRIVLPPDLSFSYTPSPTDQLLAHRWQRRAYFVAGRLEPRIVQKLQEAEHETRQLAHMVSLLSERAQSLPPRAEQTANYVHTSALEPFRASLHGELLRFYQSLGEDLQVGIEEEKRTGELYDALPDFISGSWQDFLQGLISDRADALAEKLTQTLQEHTERTLSLLLQDSLPEELYRQILSQLTDTIQRQTGTPNISPEAPISCSPTLSSERPQPLSRVLPAAFLAVGGVAILAQAFVPGALLALIGYQSYQRIDQDSRQKLLQIAQDYNKLCLSQSEHLLDTGLDESEEQIKAVSTAIYQDIASELLRIRESYQCRHDEALRLSCSYRIDLETVRELYPV